MKKYADNSRQRGYDWWGTWRPDYEGWLQCTDSLYAPQAIINAIGGEQKHFGSVYRWRKDELTCQKIACNDCKIRQNKIETQNFFEPLDSEKILGFVQCFSAIAQQLAGLQDL